MKWFVTFGAVVILVVISAIFFKQKVGDVRPALIPSTDEFIQKIEDADNSEVAVGDAVNFPLKIKDGFKVGIFAKTLGKARDLQFTPKGTLLVSTLSHGRVLALPDKDQDGKADQIIELLGSLNNPHGLAFYNNQLFVAETDKVVRYNFDEEKLEASLDKVLFSLPNNGGHNTRSIVFDSKGQMFVSVGSSCNVCLEKHQFLASVITSDSNGTNPRVYSKGLRNAVFLTLNQSSDQVWVTEMGRDMLGDNTPPEEINILKDGADYGWPTCYSDRVYDTNFKGENDCAATEPPVFKMCPHCAPLGLTFIKSDQFPKEWEGDLLVSLHGSWNSSVPVGYKVIKLDVEGNTIKSEEDFLTGFLEGGEAQGRPVDLEFDSQGSLYLSDDKAGVIYKISKND